MPPMSLAEYHERYGHVVHDHDPVPGAHVYEGEHDLDRLVDAKRADAVRGGFVCWSCTSPIPDGVGYGKGKLFAALLKRGDYGGFPPWRSPAEAAALVEDERCPVCTKHINGYMVDLQFSQRKH